jgi:large subunit ribosomal protein L47
MRAIKHTLTERFYSWEDAVKLAKVDPEINLSGDPVYQPLEYVDEEAFESGEFKSEGSEPIAGATEERVSREQEDLRHLNQRPTLDSGG